MLSRYEVRKIESAAELEQAFRLRYEVYCHEYCYLAARECPDGQERDQWDAVAHHFALYNPQGEMVGTARLVPDSLIGFPTGSYGTFPSRNVGAIFETSRLTLHHTVRGEGHAVLLDMWKVMIDFSRRQGVRYLYASTLASTWKLLLKVGLYLAIIGEPKLWSRAADDSVIVIPALYDLEAGDQYMHHVNPKAYEYIYGANPGRAHDAIELSHLLTQIRADLKQIKASRQSSLKMGMTQPHAAYA